MENQAYLWPKNQNIDTTIFIGVREGGIYKVTGKYIAAMTHESHVSFGIGVLEISTSDHSLVCRKLGKVCLVLILYMMLCVEVVP